MSDNQTSSEALAELRQEIDSIDDALLDLIDRRLAASRAVVDLKNSDSDGRLKLRPRREAAIVRRLAERALRAPPELVLGIWRQLMGHGLQAQVRTEIVLCSAADRGRIEALSRARFGPAAPVRWVATPTLALEAAREREAVAVIAPDAVPDLDPDGSLTVFDVIRTPEGEPIALAIGRVGGEDIAEDVPRTLRAIAARRAQKPAPAAWAPSLPIGPGGWTPASWRERPAAQMPDYPDASALARVERRLASSPPLAAVEDSLHLRALLAQVSAGRAFALQGGDCAESFAEFGADKVRMTFNLLLQMGAMLRQESGSEVVHLARIAGQFAKPRSSPVETVGEVTLPSYRGDAVNGPAFTEAARTPDPKRLLDAHRQAQVTVDLLKAYAAASFADLAKINRAANARLGSGEEDYARPPRPVSMFTSHEALLLNYEESLTRFDERSESWWATSGHMIWLGDRTRQLDGAHVEFARGIANPVGLKCGPSLDVDDMLRLIERLDPDNRPGRLVLIGRFGAEKVGGHLPALMRATRAAGRNAIWSIDPMHGNTRSVGQHKTRLLTDILREVETFFAVARAEGVHPGGIHLEMTGGAVTECLGGSEALREEDLPRNYLTHCDPRLNQQQALDVAATVARLLAGQAMPASHAA